MFLIRYSWYYIFCETWTVPGTSWRRHCSGFLTFRMVSLTFKHTIDSFRNFHCGILLDSRVIEHFKRKGTGSMEISWTLKWTWRRNISFENNASTQKLGTSYTVRVCVCVCVCVCVSVSVCACTRALVCRGKIGESGSISVYWVLCY